MSKIINVHGAKTHLTRLIDKAHADEEIVLFKARKPYAKLVPLENLKGSLGFIKERLDARLFKPLPAAELDGWHRQ